MNIVKLRCVGKEGGYVFFCCSIHVENPKKAFSFGLTDTGKIGPFSTDLTLKFNKGLSNIGQTYNVHSGTIKLCL